MNYTKGEWQIKSTYVDDYVIYVKQPDYDIDICTIEQDSDETMKANAHLIAASPAMYEALKEVMRFFGAWPEFVPNPERMDEIIKAIKQAKQALAKAEER